MKKIVGAVIITLFLIPSFSYFLGYLKESVNQRKKIVSKAANNRPDGKAADAVKKTTGDVKPTGQMNEPNIHDDILSYRLNSKDHIKQIQACLNRAGFYNGDIDGKMGAQTRAAIKEFQKAKKLNSDGVVGSRTWEALEGYLKN